MELHTRNLWLAGAVVAALMAGGSIVQAAEIESSIARGGKLYDKWFGENKTEKPGDTHATYPADGNYSKDATWRCKECHGWDNLGKDGAYGSGKHATGIVGIRRSMGGDPAAVAALLRNKTHGYSEAQLSAEDVEDLALFVTQGQIDMAPYVDEATKKPIGDGAKGEVYYNTLCIGCHGIDGAKIKEAPLGPVADNVPEMLHKIWNGQPGEAMPALRALDHQIAADIVVHLQTFPK